MNKSFLLLVFISILSTFTSCDNKELPDELKELRTSLNDEKSYLENRETTASSVSDFEQLISEYIMHKENALNYVSQKEELGFDVSQNREIIDQIEIKISDLQGKLTEAVEKAKPMGWNCSVCDVEFFHNGYNEVSTGNWVKCKDPIQCQVCSPECGQQITEKWVNLVGF